MDVPGVDRRIRHPEAVFINRPYDIALDESEQGEDPQRLYPSQGEPVSDGSLEYPRRLQIGRKASPFMHGRRKGQTGRLLNLGYVGRSGLNVAEFDAVPCASEGANICPPLAPRLRLPTEHRLDHDAPPNDGRTCPLGGYSSSCW